ncbi:hypothetical protein NGR_c19020 [Sinorhizobium fredii NGR234]|uniref:Uncharacterized protein n=1 Tax=Sinorhizobium fredii (strain NBRC 101917 / NGR234) TaxID=394 RepID=C3MDZ7_SINFN|nr:hypothetical protein NGR_c19020 [Sinorhizobium fredii NGR234]
MRRISDFDDFYEAPLGLGGALELRDFGEEANSRSPNWGRHASRHSWGGEEFAQARPPTRRGLPARSPAQEQMADQIGILMRQIRRLNPNEAFLEPPGGSSSVQARGNLHRRLEELQRAQIVDPRTGLPIQRYIVDPRGNIAFEPLGGSTVPGANPVDTHTRYSNGSNYHRMNPRGHWYDPTPHGHGHLMGTGRGKNNQGPSLDIYGNVVPYDSPEAHWPIR